MQSGRTDSLSKVMPSSASISSVLSREWKTVFTLAVTGACPTEVFSISRQMSLPYSLVHFSVSHTGAEYSIESSSVAFLPFGSFLSFLINSLSIAFTKPLAAGFLFFFASFTDSSTAALSGTESIYKS